MKSRKKLLAILMAAVMALTSITVALAVTTADNVKTEGFEMPDKALLQAFLDDGADANEDGILTVAEMESVTGLGADWYEGLDRAQIQNLSGIEVAKNLGYLDLEGNAIEDITPLKSLKQLEDVYLRGNNVAEAACWELAQELVRPLIAMEGEQIFLEDLDSPFGSKRVLPYISYDSGDTWGTIMEIGLVSCTPENPSIAKVEYTDRIQDGRIIAQKAGNTLLKMTSREQKVIEVPLQVMSVPDPVTTTSKNIPVLSPKMVWLYKTDQNGQRVESDDFGSKGGATALYPSGELYYIGNHGEVMLAENVKDYVAVNTYGYVGNSVYWKQFNILDNQNTLWGWGWKEGEDRPQLNKIAENITEFSMGTALDSNGNLLDIRSETVMPIIMTDVAQIDGVEYALKNDGTVWKNVYSDPHRGASQMYYFTKLDEDVQQLISHGGYIKEDGSTWIDGEKVADFSAVEVFGDTCWGYNESTQTNGDFYIVIKEDMSVWKVSRETGECSHLADHFLDWRYENWESLYGADGFYTSDGFFVSLKWAPTLEASTGNLHADKSLWCVYQDWRLPEKQNYKILTDVEDFVVGAYEEIYAVRSDGSIWMFDHNSMNIPVMIKAPVDGEPLPTYTLGDVNLDGKVNTSDARLALRGAAKLEALTPQQILAADVNKNGKADTSDARKILRVAAKLDQF
ncbi:MAG TPA: hypothetical protein IAD07_09075 [Candidatus Fimivicinus intestinavium]|nr:hypothetical protein [Candidatus Fimivicinus intestinavium]